MRNQGREKWVGMRFSASCLVAILFGAPLAGCAADDPFSAETDDEYKEQITNAVIGTPNSVTTISPTGVSQVAEGQPGVVIGSGSGGATGTGGSTAGGAAGVAGKAGSGSGNVPGSGGFGEGGEGDPG